MIQALVDLRKIDRDDEESNKHSAEGASEPPAAVAHDAKVVVVSAGEGAVRRGRRSDGGGVRGRSVLLPLRPRKPAPAGAIQVAGGAVQARDQAPAAEDTDEEGSAASAVVDVDRRSGAAAVGIRRGCGAGDLWEEGGEGVGGAGKGDEGKIFQFWILEKSVRGRRLNFGFFWGNFFVFL